VLLKGEVPSPANPPTGCYFHPRCPHATEQCRREAPLLRDLAPGHSVRCHHAERLDLAAAG
jgi:peptide/nickel transport system ATP-binding protein